MNKLKLISKIENDNYTEYVCQKYDIQFNEEHITEIPMLNIDELNTFNWNIGINCGNSGSGKSTILNQLGELIKPQYDYNKAIISQFPNLTENEVTELFCAVGLSSVPIWLHKPNELSNGEMARFELAWIIANSKNNEIILYDEFTSVVNRDSAKSLSYSLQRYIRDHNLKIILASCHFDIIEWLRPDWVYNLNKRNNGDCEIERLIYNDNNEYNLYKSISKDNLLSNLYEIKNY